MYRNVEFSTFLVGMSFLSFNILTPCEEPSFFIAIHIGRIGERTRSILFVAVARSQREELVIPVPDNGLRWSN